MITSIVAVVTLLVMVLCGMCGYWCCRFRVRRGALGAIARAAADPAQKERESMVVVALYASGNDLDPPASAIYMTKEAERLWNQIVLTTLVRTVNSLARITPGEDPQE